MCQLTLLVMTLSVTPAFDSSKSNFIALNESAQLDAAEEIAVTAEMAENVPEPEVREVGAMPGLTEVREDFSLLSAATQLIAVLFGFLVAPLALATGVLTTMLIVNVEKQ